VAKVLKRLLAVVLIGGLVGVVAYATLMPDVLPTASLQGKGGGKADKRGAGNGAGGRVPVLAATAQRKDVPVLLQGVGTARPLQTVTVRPQVEGTILRVPFREGQQVKAGDLLAEIDPAVYKAQLDQLTAKRALTEVQLANARRDLDRYLQIAGVTPQKTIDTQRAQVDQLAAQVKADTAAIASAQTTLGFTRITSPLTGRAGMRLVDEGNLVRAGEGGIVVITQLQPIAVQFTLPQQQLAQVNKALAAGPVSVEALEPETSRVIDTGVLQVVDNQVDPQTGTVKMKAEFPNAQQQLWPGQFANVRVQVDTLHNVVTIPMSAVQRGPAGTFAYVIGAESKAEIRPITVGLMNEREAVVTAGLDEQVSVVTSGFARLAEGSTVVVMAAPETPPADAAKKRKRDGGPQAKGETKTDGQGAPQAATAATGQGPADVPAAPKFEAQSTGQGQGRGQGEGKRRREGAAVLKGEAANAPAAPRESVQ